MRTKKALLVLAAGAIVLANGCGTGSWLKWATVAAQLAYDVTGTLWYIGVWNTTIV